MTIGRSRPSFTVTLVTPGSDLTILRGRIAAARSLTILTGAGISADSGVQTVCGATFAQKTSPHRRPSHATPDWSGNGTTGDASSSQPGGQIPPMKP